MIMEHYHPSGQEHYVNLYISEFECLPVINVQVDYHFLL